MNSIPPHGPGVAYRRLFVAMTCDIAEGDLAGATKAGQAAYRIAKDQNWWPLQVVIFQALGAAHLSSGKPDDALDFYREGVSIARKAADEKDPAGRDLVVQTRLAEAAVLFGNHDYGEAGTIYEEVAPLAEEQDDLIVAMDSWRMAAYCKEKVHDHDLAWKYGIQALNVGEKLDADIRSRTTLPYAGKGLLDLTRRAKYAARAEEIRKLIEDLCGPDWEQAISGK